MNFKRENISTFHSSLGFLIESMLNTCNFINKNTDLHTKSSWSIQTEKFSSFFERIRTNNEVIENLRSKVVYPIFDSNSSFLLGKLIDDKNVVQDDFMKVSEDNSNDFKLTTGARGIVISVSKLFLPISEVYTDAVNYSVNHKKENIPFPVQILLGFYSCIYHSILGVESDDQAQMIKENIDVLVDSLESCDVPREQSNKNPMNMIQNMLGNIDMKQIGDMMSKVTGDKDASKEFGDVFGKMTEAIKSGTNPMEIVGDIIKNAAAEAEAVPETEQEAVAEAETEAEPAQEAVSEADEIVPDTDTGDVSLAPAESQE